MVGTLAFVHGLVHAQILLIPVLLVAWQAAFGLLAWQEGFLAAVAYVAYGGSSVPVGYLADGATGGRRLLLFCLGGAALALVAMGLAPVLPVLVPGLAVLGLLLGIYHPTGLALLSRGTADPGRAMGVHGVGGSLGIALGPLAGAVLLAALPWNFVLLAFVAPTVLAAVMVARWPLGQVLEVATRQGMLTSLRRVLQWPFPLVMMVYFFAGVAYWGALTFLPSFLHKGLDLALPTLDLGLLTLTAGAYVLALLLALGAVGQFLSGYLSSGPAPEATLALLTAAAGLVLFPLGLVDRVLLVPLALAFGLLLFSMEPLQNTLVLERTAPEDRGLAFGLTFLSVFGLGALGAAVGGAVVGAWGFGPLFPLLALPLGLSGLASWALRARRTTKARHPDSRPLN